MAWMAVEEFTAHDLAPRRHLVRVIRIHLDMRVEISEAARLQHKTGAVTHDVKGVLALRVARADTGHIEIGEMPVRTGDFKGDQRRGTKMGAGRPGSAYGDRGIARAGRRRNDLAVDQIDAVSQDDGVSRPGVCHRHTQFPGILNRNDACRSRRRSQHRQNGSLETETLLCQTKDSAPGPRRKQGVRPSTPAACATCQRFRRTGQNPVQQFHRSPA